jgi:hypothetical protein
LGQLLVQLSAMGELCGGDDERHRGRGSSPLRT